MNGDLRRGPIRGTAQPKAAPSLLPEAAANDFGFTTSDDSRGGTRTLDPGIMSAVL